MLNAAAALLGRMTAKNALLQLVGPLCTIAALLCAELAAYALLRWPTSEFLWYVNLELFRNFQYCCTLLPERLVSSSFALLVRGKKAHELSARIRLRPPMPPLHLNQ